MTLEFFTDWDDTILPFQLDASDIRGRVARLDSCLNQILEQHDYPPDIEALVAEAVILTALIGQTIKLRWKLSLQIRGNGPARLVATDFFAPENKGAPARIRAFASYDSGRLDPELDPVQQMGDGYFSILIDQGKGNTPYSGMTPLTGKSLSDCASGYFTQSEQLPTSFALSYGRSSLPGQPERWRAGGVMLQHMPKASPFIGAKSEAQGESQPASREQSEEMKSENWARANILLNSVEEMELIGPKVSPTNLLLRLFHEEKPRIFDAQPVGFGCTCSRERVMKSLSIYSDKDISHMTTDTGIVTADCQFCGAHYKFEPKILGFEAAERANGGQ